MPKRGRAPRRVWDGLPRLMMAGRYFIERMKEMRKSKEKRIVAMCENCGLKGVPSVRGLLEAAEKICNDLEALAMNSAAGCY